MCEAYGGAALSFAASRPAWHQYGVVWQAGANTTITLDGVPVAGPANTGGGAPDGITLFAAANGAVPSSAEIFACALYSRALTPAELLKLAAFGRAKRWNP